jgi:hypothetical protein
MRFTPSAEVRLRTALLCSLAIAAAVLLTFRGIYEADLWWHLAQGRENAAGRLVRTNVFNFIYSDYPQPYTPWLYDLAGYGAWQLAEGVGIQLLHGALVALTFVLVYLACRERAPAAAALAILVIGFFVVEPRAIPRPHLASLAGMAACTLLIERARRLRTAAPLRWTIPVVALWSNLHVECISGVLLVGVFACAELVYPSALPRREARRAIALAAAAALATMANPYGWGLGRYLFENLYVPQLLNIAELRAPYLPDYRAFFVWLALTAVSMLAPWRAASLSDFATAATFAALGVNFLRFTPLLFVVSAPVVAARAGWLIARGLDSRAAVAIAVAAGLTISRLPIAAFVEPRLGTSAVAPPAFLSPGLPAFARLTGLGGPVFNSMNLGGHLAWTLYPDTKIFQDGRLQAVPPEHFRAIIDASRSQAAWDALVAGVDWAVLSNPRPNQLSGAGRFPRDRWATIYWDEAVEVLVRRGSRFDPLVQSYEYVVLLPEADAFVLAEQLGSSGGERLRAEARRNMTDNPDGFVAAAVSCLADAADACARVDRFGEQPMFRDAASRVRQLRAGRS